MAIARELEQWKASTYKLLKTYKVNPISTYATKNEAELFAETYQAWFRELGSGKKFGTYGKRMKGPVWQEFDDIMVRVQKLLREINMGVKP